MSKLVRLGCRAAVIAAGVVYGVYKGVQEMRAMRDAIAPLFAPLFAPSAAAEALAEITTLSPYEVQERLDAGITVEELKGLVVKRYGTWGQA